MLRKYARVAIMRYEQKRCFASLENYVSFLASRPTNLRTLLFPQ
jgi:hypothetical protein